MSALRNPEQYDALMELIAAAGEMAEWVSELHGPDLPPEHIRLEEAIAEALRASGEKEA